MKAMAWIRHVLGLGLKERAKAAQLRQLHNQRSVEGAIAALKQYARDHDK